MRQLHLVPPLRDLGLCWSPRIFLSALLMLQRHAAAWMNLAASWTDRARPKAAMVRPRWLTEQQHAIQALVDHRPDEPFRVGVAVRRPHGPDALLFKEGRHGTAPLEIAIADQRTRTESQATCNRESP